MAENGVTLHDNLSEAESHGVAGIIDVGITPDDIFERSRALGRYEFVLFAIGLHPTEIELRPARRRHDDLARIVSGMAVGSDLEAIADRVVAIGEIGLDYYWDDTTAALQRETLVELFGLAAEHHLPVILHNRASDHDMLDLVRSERPRGVMHCFSQDREYCKRLLDLDMFISFGGNLTYKKSSEIREAAAFVPDDKLLVETDSPYLSPQAVRGTTNQPGHLGFTIEALAAIRETTTERITEITSRNARALFQ
jgi:TatD DNase family protein